MSKPVKGYKVFNPDWTCRGFKYAVGETFEEEVELLIMRAGEVDGENVMDIVDDEEELAKVAKVFAQRLEEMFEIDIDSIGETEE